MTDEYPTPTPVETPLQKAAREVGWEATATAEKRAMGLRPPIKSEEQLEALKEAILPLVEMYKAVPPQAQDECIVETRLIMGDLRRAFHAYHGVRNA